jgi:15-cis-phytoene synthase
MILFHNVSEQCSRITTSVYSTSFSGAVKLLHRDIRNPIYNIYGFVRFADEIVDTFHDFNKPLLFMKFKEATYEAMDQKISLNPILHSFQLTANAYRIDRHLIDSFFKSMEADLFNTRYDPANLAEYIYGSAEVVGLMCLHVFCEGDSKKYMQLRDYARSLGAAFQKVNFLRDLKSDYEQLNRLYFPGMDFHNFTSPMKKNIEDDIAADFKKAYEGILLLPEKARFGVYVAYKYYLSLFNEIRRFRPREVLQKRIRIPGYRKMMILAGAGLKRKLNLI